MDFEAQPILVFWETTRACLLACRHCRAAAIDHPLPGELSTAEAAAFVRQLTGFGPRPPVLILTGGDPLMRRDLFDLGRLAHSLGIPIGVAPSVTPMLTEENLDRLKEIGVKGISISLDGAEPATHERIRGVPDHFARTVAALELLVERGFTVQVNTTVMRENATELAAVAALLKAVGVAIWEVFFLVRVGRGADVQELSPAENEDVAHFLVDASRYGLLVRTVEGPFFRRVLAFRAESGPHADAAEAFSLGPLYRDLAGELRGRLGEPDGPPRARSARTRDGSGVVFVAHDGEVYPSGFLPLSLGNVRRRSIVNLYRFHPLLRAIRQAEFAGRCGACSFRDSCGGSRARAYAASGDPLGEDPGCAFRPAGEPAPRSSPRGRDGPA